MGYAKYVEDDNEVIDERWYEMYPIDYSVVEKESPKFVCSYCDMIFDSKELLYEHIKQIHNKVGALVIVNEKVAFKDMYVKKILSLKVVKYDTNLSVYINDNIVEINDIEINEMDLMPFIEKNNIDTTELKIMIGNKVWLIQEVSEGNINIISINNIITEWIHNVSEGKFIVKENIDSLNILEKRCLDGFYNYFIACLTSNQSDKKKRYEEAFGILLEFVQIVPSARFVLKIIAFKFNWFERLKQFSIDEDVFLNISKFMLNDANYITLSQRDNSEMYVEDDISDLLKIIVAFIDKRYKLVEEYLSKFTDDILLKNKDANFNDKIYLLKARLAVVNDNKRLARRYYEEIQSPILHTEFKKFMKNY